MIGLPDEETMACQDGLYENHFYADLRYMWTWADFEEAWAQEDALLAAVDAGWDLESDEAFEVFCDNPLYVLDLDPGTASTVAALVCLGAVPFTSCNGEPGHYETHPLVACWVPSQEVFAQMQAAAAKAGVNVEELETAVLVWHPHDVQAMRAFARALYDRRT